MSEDLYTEHIRIKAESVSKQIEQLTYNIIKVHAKALACHCECLAMNAENSLACCENRVIPYADVAYFAVLKKWGLIDKEREPLI